MQYTVLISETTGGQWQAIVPVLPGCTAEAATREEALALIKEKLIAAASNFEVVQIEVPASVSQNGQPKKSSEEEWPGFGAFKDDPNWGDFFTELDRQRQ